MPLVLREPTVLQMVLLLLVVLYELVLQALAFLPQVLMPPVHGGKNHLLIARNDQVLLFWCCCAAGGNAMDQVRMLSKRVADLWLHMFLWFAVAVHLEELLMSSETNLSPTISATILGPTILATYMFFSFLLY
uniref:Uncharacterized protein n=1 Tax=Oryza barthii TaxID=65489 RepID=A0A0D3F464_9ORYZ